MIPQPARIFSLTDFGHILELIKTSSPLIGGQAVAWWARRYDVVNAAQGEATALTSHDIDFWGDRKALRRLADALEKTPRYPNEYEMTAWTGSIDLRINDQATVVEFLRSVVGLDIDDPEATAVTQQFGHYEIRVLDPISLIYSKIHGLRVFDQTTRQDFAHLKICIATAKSFIEEVLAEDARLGLWYCERILKCAFREVNRKVAKKHRFNLLEAIPIPALEQKAKAPRLSAEDQQRLRNFLEQRWARLEGHGGVPNSRSMN